MNFIGKWQPPPSHRASSHRKGEPMRRNRELGNLFHNLLASKFYKWLLLFLYRLKMRPKDKKTQVPRLFNQFTTSTFMFADDATRRGRNNGVRFANS